MKIEIDFGVIFFFAVGAIDIDDRVVTQYCVICGFMGSS